MSKSIFNLIKIIPLLLCLFGGNVVFSQDVAPFNKINVAVLNPLHFAYANAQDLLSTKVINNALEIAIKVKNENTSVYAQANIMGPAPFPPLLSMRSVNKTSPDASISSAVVNLSETPNLLFTQPMSLQETKHYSFIYDLLLRPSPTMIEPGNYNFSISFTITAQ